MPKTRAFLQPILKLLEQKPLTTPEITNKLKKHRKVIRENLIWAEQKGWIQKDELGRNQLTIHGKSIVGIGKKTMDSTVFEVNSQVVSPPEMMKGLLTAKCTIYTKNVQRIMELDKNTREIHTALAMSGYGTIENTTNIQASAGALVDAILDLKAKDLGLFSTLESDYTYAIGVFNYETMPTGYDFMKRFKELAGTQLQVFIQFDGPTWVKKQNFGKLEKEHQILYETSKKSSNRIRSLDDKRKIMFVVHKLIDPDWAKEDKLETMNFFETKKELIDYVYRLFKRFGVEQDKLEEVLRSGFNSEFFQTKKMAVHHLTINRANESRFFKSLSFLHSNNLGSLKEEPIFHMTESKEVNGRYADPKYLVTTVSRQLDEFERAFFNTLERVIDKFEKAKFIDGVLDTYPSSDGKEPAHLKAAKESLLQLLDIFYEAINVCMLRSTILWPQKIKDTKILYKLNFIVFNKITDMRQVLCQALSSFHSGRFNSDFVNNAMANTYATKVFSKYYKTFKNSGSEEEGEPLLDSMWSLYEEIKDWAFPEPSMYRWDFDYAKDGWKKFLEIQDKHPGQTSDNYYNNYMRQYGPVWTEDRSH